MTPDPVHKVTAMVDNRTFRRTGLLPVKYCITALLVPSGRMRPRAWLSSRISASVRCENESMEANTRIAGNKVRIAEKAAALATANASC